jgi:hypothetical protein
MLEFLGKSARTQIVVDYAARLIFNAKPRYDYIYWDRSSSAYNPGSTTFYVNIGTNLFATSVGEYALDLQGFTTGDIINVTIDPTVGVYGAAGQGGQGADNSNGQNLGEIAPGGFGGGGGTAIYCYAGGAQVNIVNNGTIAAGGGGGGGGCATTNIINQYGVYNVCTTEYIGGDGGSGGAGSRSSMAFADDGGGYPGPGGGIDDRNNYPFALYTKGQPGNRGTLYAGGASVYTGGAGGGWGQAGADGLSNPGINSAGGIGGPGGSAMIAFYAVNSYSGSGRYYGPLN